MISPARVKRMHTMKEACLRLGDSRAGDIAAEFVDHLYKVSALVEAKPATGSDTEHLAFKVAVALSVAREDSREDKVKMAADDSVATDIYAKVAHAVILERTAALAGNAAVQKLGQAYILDLAEALLA